MQWAILKEYAQYVSRVHKYASAMELDVAVKRAIDECIKEGILVDFLFYPTKQKNTLLKQNNKRHCF